MHIMLRGGVGERSRHGRESLHSRHEALPLTHRGSTAKEIFLSPHSLLLGRLSRFRNNTVLPSMALRLLTPSIEHSGRLLQGWLLVIIQVFAQIFPFSQMHYVKWPFPPSLQAYLHYPGLFPSQCLPYRIQLWLLIFLLIYCLTGPARMSE